MKETSFTFERGRGLVWVCDVQESSKFLNDDKLAQAVEEYFPRLHWLGKVGVSAAGGHFLKWTGDGFMGWFPIDLHRELGTQATRVIDIIRWLTIINDITGFGIETSRKFRLSHGLTMEHDALLTKVSDENGEQFDIIGRSVVLACRLSGMKVSFPGVVTQREIVEATEKVRNSQVKFNKINLNAEDRLRYFKGERWGTTNLYYSAERRPRPRSIESLLKAVKKTIEEAEKPQTIQDETNPTIKQFMEDLLSGPKWTQEVFRSYVSFTREDLLGEVKQLAQVLESLPKK